MATQFEYDVFLSHASADKLAVRKLAERLKRDCLRVWFDEWIIQPGDSIPVAIEHGLESSRTLILLMSKAAFASEWVSLERHTALFRDPTNQRRRFIPLRLDSSEIKDTLKQFAYIDWRDEDERQYARLLRACAPYVTREQQVSTESFRDDSSARTLLTHRERVQCVAMSSDGTVVLSGGDDRALHVWRRVGNSTDIRSLAGHTHFITGVAASQDGGTAVTSSYDGRIRIWDISTGTTSNVMKIMPQGDPIMRMACTPDCRRIIVRTEEVNYIDYFVADYDDQNEPDDDDIGDSDDAIDFGCCITVLDMVAGDIIGDFNERQTGSKAVAIAADGALVAYGGEAGCIYVRDVEHGERLPVLNGHHGIVTGIAFISHSHRLVSCSSDQTIRVWDYERGKCIYVLEGHTCPVVGVQLAQDSKVLISCAIDGTVIAWNVETGKRLMEVSDGPRYQEDDIRRKRVYLDERTAFATSSDGRSAVTASIDTRVRHFGIPQHETTSDQTYYTNAKILLVGDSGVGKSGLAIRLTQNKFEPTVSTDAHWATQLKLPYDTESDSGSREIWLWDFAGQADYRLIHQLFMDETSLAVLVFNPQSESPFDGLAQWHRDLARAARRSFAKILVAGRCDRGGLMVSRDSVDRFIARHEFALYLETSALTGQGCELLRREIVSRIDWDSIPWTASPRIFKKLKDEILRLRDEGVVLLKMAEMKQQLEMRLLDESFSIEELRAVIGLLAGPGLVWKLEFGDVVILQPEWINRYAAAVIRSVRAHTGEIGVIDEGRVLSGDLNYTMDVARPKNGAGDGAEIEMQRLNPSDETIVLRAMHQMFVDHGLCVREDSDAGGRHLVFPSYFKEELPADPGHPPVLVTYQFEGHAEEIYATLIVQLWHTKAFENGALWRHAADFKSATGARLGLKMDRQEDNKPEISVYFDAHVSDDTKVTFIKYVHEHLLQKARNVARLRAFVCPHCSHPVRDVELARDILYKNGANAEIRCQHCDKRFALWDVIEHKFASKEFQGRVKQLEEVAKATIDNESRELILEGHARVITGEAGQIYRGYTGSDHGIDGEIEFKDNSGRASGKRLYLQLKSGDSYLYERKSDGAEVFHIKNPRWEKYWRSQAYPVMLVIRTSNGEIRWMNVSEYLERERNLRSALIKEIKFDGEPFTALSVQRVRDNVLVERKA